MVTLGIKSAVEIARHAKMMPIDKIAVRLGISSDDLEQYGKHKAKVSLDLYQRLKATAPTGKLVLVTAITPTPAGEGKTTTTIGLGDALNRIGKKAIICVREPSLGPCFGMKGGAAGGGYAQIVPMVDINLHFTGDFHAITSAHNLLSAVIDNHLHHGNALGLDPRRITWKHVMDMNDRALRQIVIGLGGTGNGVPRESGFDITVASEVMAIFCLSESLEDLKHRLGQIIVGYTYDKNPVTAAQLKVHGAMAGPGGEHTTTVGGEGVRPTRKQCLDVGERFDLKTRDMEASIDRINDACSTWTKLAKNADCTSRMIRTVQESLQPLS